jgi:hypothetical protein
MPVIIKSRGAKATAKSAPKRGTKTAAKRPTAASQRKAKTAAKAEPTRVNRSSKTDIPERQLNSILKRLNEAAELRKELFEAHREAVDASNALILDAEQMGVPVHMIVEHADIARQQFYKLLSDYQEGKLGNGKHGAARQRPGRKAETPKAAAKTTAPKRAITRKATAKVAPKRTIRRK